MTLSKHPGTSPVPPFNLTQNMAHTGSILASGVNPFDRTYHHPQQVFDHNIIQIIAEILLLNLTLVKTPLITDIRSYEKSPDNWILEQIVNGTAEISSSTVILSPESQNTVSYSFGIGTYRPQLYYKATSLREGSNIYMIPFSSQLWLCLSATVFLLFVVLMFILSRETKLPHEISYDVLARIIDVQQDRDEEISTQDIQNTPKEVLLQKEKWEMGEILLVCLGAACQQGSARDPSTNAARILILCLFILAVVGYTAYSASLISLVSLFPSTEREQRTDVKYFSREYKTLLYNMRNLHDLNVSFEETEFTNLKKGFDWALEGKAVFAGDRDISLTFLHQEKYKGNLRCTLGRTFLGMEYHKVLALKKNSRFKKQINYSILQLRQFGLLDREKRRSFNTEPPCTLQDKLSISNFVSFNGNDVKPILNVFIFGVLISLLLLVIENLIFLCPRRKRNFLP